MTQGDAKAKPLYRIAVIEFPGTNCERETALAIRRAGMEPEIFRWNRPQDCLDAFDAFIVPGGFSYEDRSRSGIIAALDTLLDGLKKQNAMGKPILGICNGAQILVESGIVPGLSGWQTGAALAPNKQIVDGIVVGTGFYNDWVHVKHTVDGTVPERNAFSLAIADGSLMRIPAAHAEGRFVIDDYLLSWLERNGVAMFRYADSNGTVNPHFPVNPNGATSNLAALGNIAGTALAIMPHPERTPEGDSIFISLKNWLDANSIDKSSTKGQKSLPKVPQDIMERLVSPLTYTSLPYHIRQEGIQEKELVIGTVITDNAAVSVEQALERAGIPVKVSRAVRWTLEASPSMPRKDFDALVAKAMASGQLYNSNKEFPVDFSPSPKGLTIVVTPREGEDFTGLHARHALSTWFGIEGFTAITSSVLWTLEPTSSDPEQGRRAIDAALASNIFANPYSQRTYAYA
ncbi:phosphoribosylformylglycinamidine synthase I [Parasphaerochaeta coccoides]|uniref:Phosphoribosylformylglycinamidine synthase I n=1 Tax=Parasphaerochaeta coccoides (strain ATCC BAA-1237 / DSM 17374 / SPN1) TaxID=760011 RepID=F4GHX0_PARC1|nr:phosphoribosylformylglycinamidine synthase I [Parasphaerochaeta coccoides]AEC02083.1 phosphoribosylformylglycinamidine synthase I [Parasphaerochaeta coccoides DSM 17374]